MKREWNEVEDDFLIKNYKSGNMNKREIAEVLGRTFYSVKKRVTVLGIRYMEDIVIPEGYARCSKCKGILPIDNFTKSPKGSLKINSWCKTCTHAKYLQSIMSNNENKEIIISKVCKNCGAKKPISEFWKSCRSKDGHAPTCKVCSNAQDRQRKSKKVKVL